MPKLKNVTVQELAALKETSDNLLMELHDINERIEKGYVDRLESSAELAQHFNAVTRACAQMTSLLLLRLAMDEQKAGLEALLRERSKGKEP